MTAQIQVGDLVLSVEEAEDTLQAIRRGFVDAVVVEGTEGNQVFTFKDPSHPYRLLVEAMSEGAALLTHDGVVCYHNPRMAELSGANGTSLCGRPLSDLVSKDETARVEGLLVQARSGAARAEIGFVRENSGVLPVLLSVSAGVLADVPVFCVVATDLSEHKRQEELYRAARLEVEGRDRLFSVAAHELRGPLGVLEMQTQLLIARLRGMSEAPAGPIEKTISMVETVGRQGKQLAQLVTKLLDLGSIGSGHLDLILEEVDLAEVVRAVIQDSSDLIHRSGYAVILDLESVLGHWDRVRLEQVVANLLSNAVKYGLGRPIRVAVQPSEHMARLRVEDQGGGIPANERERIFRPFERLVTTKAVAGGLGLGLYIAAEIVRVHEGTIRVEGEPDSGSCFVVELPLETQKPPTRVISNQIQRPVLEV